MTAFHRPPARTLLLIDADAENRQFFKQEFEAENFMVLEAENATEALTIFKAQKIDAVVVDQELSHDERRNLLNSLRSNKFGDPVVFMLASPYSISREEAYDLGAAATLSKPIDPKFLISRIEDLLVPAQIRWKESNKANRKPSRRQKTVALSLSKSDIGRAGFALPISKSEELLEGDTVQFNVQINDLERCTLRGTGVIRYVKLDKSRMRQQAWGIEFESLDETSIAQMIALHTAERPMSYIPRSNLH